MFAKESNFFLVGLLAVSFALVLLLLSGFATPLVLGILLAAMSHGAYERLRVSLKDRKNLAALIILLIIVLIIILPFFGILTLLAKEAFGLISQIQAELETDTPFQGIIQNLATRFNLNAEELEDILRTKIVPNIADIGTFISNQIGSLLSNASRLAIAFFVLIMTIFYLLRDGKALGSFLKRVSPLKEKDNEHLYLVFKETGQAVLFGNFISAVTQGFLGGLGFLLFGLESPVFWGTIMAFISLIPLLGPYIISIPATIYLFMIGNPVTAIAFLLYNMLIVSTADNIVKPKLIGSKINIHPLFILMAILGGLRVFGIMGIIYGPLIASVFMALIHTAGAKNNHHENGLHVSAPL